MSDLLSGLLGMGMGKPGYGQAGQATPSPDIRGISAGAQAQITTLDVSKLQATVAVLNLEIGKVREAMEEMAHNQSELLAYIEYLNPPTGARPFSPYSYVQWRKLRQVTDVMVSAGVSPRR